MATILHNLAILKDVLTGKDVLLRSVHQQKHELSLMFTVFSLSHGSQVDLFATPKPNGKPDITHHMSINKGSVCLQFTDVKLDNSRTRLLFFQKRACRFELMLNHDPFSDKAVPVFPDELIRHRELQ